MKPTRSTPPPSTIQPWGWEWIKWLSSFFDVVSRALIKVDADSVTPWAALGLLNSWVNFGGASQVAQFQRHIGARVQLRGTIKAGTPVAGTVIGILPEGFRPKQELVFVVANNSDRGEVSVHANGNIVFETGNNAFFSLDNITFSVD